MRSLYTLTKQTPPYNLVEIWANKQQEYMVTQSNNEGMLKYYLIFLLFPDTTGLNLEHVYFWSLFRERAQFTHVLPAFVY